VSREEGRPPSAGPPDPRSGVPGPDERTRTIAGAPPDSPQIPGLVVTGTIGAGGFGAVYRARQEFLERDVALKVLRGSSVDPVFVRRFQREAKTLAGVCHPNIVTCHHAGTTESDECYLVMELIDGPDLRRHVAREGPLPPAHALLVCAEIAGALEHALGVGIIHRDVKPENILLKPCRSESAPESGFPWTAMLADLGLARWTTDAAAPQITQPGTVMGTPASMAPEQIEAPDRVDFHADVYGLGCVLYHAVTGQMAFPQRTVTQVFAAKLQGDPPDPRKHAPRLDAELAAFVLQLLARDPEDRPQSYAEVKRRCTELRERLERGAPTAAPRRRILIYAAVTLSIVALGFLVYTQRSRSRSDGQPEGPSSPAATIGSGPGGEDATPRSVEGPVSGPKTPTALFGPEQGDPLAGWLPPTDPASWQADPERVGVIGSAAGEAPVTLVHSLPAGDWMLTGEIAPLESSQGELADVVGVALELEDGETAWLKLTTLTAQQQIAHVSLPRAGAGTAPETRNTSLGGIGTTRPLHFRLEWRAGRLHATVDGGEPVDVPASAAPSRLLLHVEGGRGGFRDLVLRDVDE